MKEMAGDVETRGELTLGMTVFDRRRVPTWRHNMEVATDMHKDGVTQAIVRGVNESARLAQREEG
jgi:purine nucleosidase